MTFGLTPLQDRLLTFLRERAKTSNVSPSLNEMAAAIGIRSKSSAHGILARLEERGLVRRLHNRARAIELVEQTAAELVDRPTLELLITYSSLERRAISEVVSDAVAAYVAANHPKAPS